jgi:hypothetical protein
VGKEVILAGREGYFNIPKNLILSGTAISWWVGIVALNSDIGFTLTNVLTHGIPYMALIWLYERNSIRSVNSSSTPTSYVRKFFLASVPAFILFLWLLGYLEGGLWDGFLWREHLGFFQPFAHLPAITDPRILALLVPLLALPQSTHYVLDGFIWRVKDRSSAWSI